MRNIYNILAILFTLLCAVSCSTGDVEVSDMANQYNKATLVKIGDLAPDFTAKSVEGDDLTLSALQGKTVLLVFFSTKNKSSKKLMNRLVEVNNLFSEDKFAILAISRGDKRSVVYDYINDNGYQFPIGLDLDSSIYTLYATNYIPRCFVVDPLGRIEALSVEYDEEEFERVVDIIHLLL